MSSKEVKIKASGKAEEFGAFLSFPDRAAAPAVIVIQEIFGVNMNMREICKGLTEKGYIAICPDLFWRQEPGVQLTDHTKAEWDRAFQLYQGFNVDKGIEDLKATLSFIREYPNCNKKVGTMGFCLGGKLSYLMAARSSADCNVSYYGVGIEGLLGESEKIKKSLLMHIAEKDKFVPPAAQEKIKVSLSKNKNIDMRFYSGVDHAFARIGGEHYDQAAATKAHAATDAFFRKNLTDS